MEEVPVHRAGQGTAIGRHRGDDQQAHARQLLAQRRRIHPPVVGDDGPQVWSGGGGAFVEDPLQP